MNNIGSFNENSINHQVTQNTRPLAQPLPIANPKPRLNNTDTHKHLDYVCNPSSMIKTFNNESFCSMTLLPQPFSPLFFSVNGIIPMTQNAPNNLLTPTQFSFIPSWSFNPSFNDPYTLQSSAPPPLTPVVASSAAPSGDCNRSSPSSDQSNSCPLILK